MRHCRVCDDVRYMADWLYPCGACNPPAMLHQPRGTVWAPSCACGASLRGKPRGFLVAQRTPRPRRDPLPRWEAVLPGTPERVTTSPPMPCLRGHRYACRGSRSARCVDQAQRHPRHVRARRIRLLLRGSHAVRRSTPAAEQTSATVIWVTVPSGPRRYARRTHPDDALEALCLSRVCGCRRGSCAFYSYG